MACVLTLQVKVDPYLLINGGVAASRGHPHLLIEAIADGIRQVDTGVTVASQDRPAQQVESNKHIQFKGGGKHLPSVKYEGCYI